MRVTRPIQIILTLDWRFAILKIVFQEFFSLNQIILFYSI